MIDIAVIDDSPTDRQILLEYITRYSKEKHISINIKEFESGEEFLSEFQPTSFDILFLDIYLNGMNGMDIARQVRVLDQDCLLIFSTSSSQHAVQSYSVRAFYYLVKPYLYEQFKHVMSLCDKTLMVQARYIEVKESRVLERIFLRDIIYVDYYKHYVQLHTKVRIIKSYMPFSDVSSELLAYPQFACCYRNLIVNMDEVEALEDAEFTMKNGEIIPIARVQRSHIRQLYADYILSKLERGI